MRRLRLRPAWFVQPASHNQHSIRMSRPSLARSACCRSSGCWTMSSSAKTCWRTCPMTPVSMPAAVPFWRRACVLCCCWLVHERRRGSLPARLAGQQNSANLCGLVSVAHARLTRARAGPAVLPLSSQRGAAAVAARARQRAAVGGAEGNGGRGGQGGSARVATGWLFPPLVQGADSAAAV